MSTVEGEKERLGGSPVRPDESKRQGGRSGSRDCNVICKHLYNKYRIRNDTGGIRNDYEDSSFCR